jgi:hypothetical protein
MKNEALLAAVVAALFDYPLTIYLEKRPETSTLYRMVLVGGLTYVGVVAASALLETSEEN